MKLDYDNQRTRGRKSFADVQEVEEKTPFDIFEDLYEKQNNPIWLYDAKRRNSDRAYRKQSSSGDI